MVNLESEIMDIGWIRRGGWFFFSKTGYEKYENKEKGSRKAIFWSDTFIFQFWLNWHFPLVWVLALQRFDQVDDCVCQRSPKITFSNTRLNFKGHSTPRQRQYRVLSLHFFTNAAVTHETTVVHNIIILYLGWISCWRATIVGGSI